MEVVLWHPAMIAGAAVECQTAANENAPSPFRWLPPQRPNRVRTRIRNRAAAGWVRVGFLIVWLDSEGEHLYGFVQHSDPMRHIVTTTPGETILHNGQPWRVIGVEVWRAAEKDGLLSA